MSITARLTEVFVDVFDIDPETVDEGASAETIESWDSVAHLGLVLALEAEFGVQFDAEEIPSLVSFPLIRERLTSEVGDAE